MRSNEDRREAKKGSGDEIPGRFGQQPNVPMREAHIIGNRRGAEGDNYDSDTLR